LWVTGGALTEAEQICLINKTVPTNELEEEVNRYAEALATSPSDGMVVA
jgi:enoyl-CoA hydratase/carnithine racemase